MKLDFVEKQMERCYQNLCGNKMEYTDIKWRKGGDEIGLCGKPGGGETRTFV